MKRNARNDKVQHMKNRRPMKQAWFKAIVTIAALVISYLVMCFVFKSDNFWITIIIASVLVAVFEGIYLYISSNDSECE